MSNNDVRSADIVIIFALIEEFRQFYAETAERCIGEEDPTTGSYDYIFDYPIRSPKSYHCVATFVGDMGPEDAALATQRLITKWNPLTIVMLGIAASVDSKIRIGDVVVATQVENYLDKAKVIGTKNINFIPGSDVYRPSEDLVKLVQHFEFRHRKSYQSWLDICSKKLQEIIKNEVPNQPIPSGLVRDLVTIECDHIASGDLVVGSEAFMKWLKTVDRKFIAVEMEASGFMAAVSSQAKPQKTLIIRAISDYGDKTKQDLDQFQDGAWRRYAMHNAIQLFWKLIETGKLPRHEKSGSRVSSQAPLLDQHYRDVVYSLTQGHLIPVLGSGLNLSVTHSQQNPPSEIDVVNHLTQELRPTYEDLIGFPCPACRIKLEDVQRFQPETLKHLPDGCPLKWGITITDDLSESLLNEQALAVAQIDLQCLSHYLYVRHPAGGWSEPLDDFFKRPYEPNQLETALAELTKTQREKQRKLPCPLILTTNYDLGLERAFEAETQPFDIVSYIAEGRNCGRFEHKPYQEAVRLIDMPDHYRYNEMALPLKDHPVILKLYGGALERDDESRDSFVVTEDHHINYLQGYKQPQLPTELLNLLEESDLLFVGYSPSDWILRVVMNRFCPNRYIGNNDKKRKSRDRPKVWLIHQTKPGELYKQYWDKWWGADLIEVSSLDDYIGELVNRIKSI